MRKLNGIAGFRLAKGKTKQNETVTALAGCDMSKELLLYIPERNRNFTVFRKHLGNIN